MTTPKAKLTDWKDVIQLHDSFTDNLVAARLYVEVLNQLASNPAGQKQLQTLEGLMKSPSGNIRKLTLIAPEAANMPADTIVSNYRIKQHDIVVNLAAPNPRLVTKLDITSGKRFMVPQPAAEMLSGVLQYVIEEQKTHQQQLPSLSKDCLMERSALAEAAYVSQENGKQKEATPAQRAVNWDNRQAFIESYKLKPLLDRAWMYVVLKTGNGTLAPKSVGDLVRAVQKDAGCATLSQDTVIQRARNVLVEAGIPDEAVNDITLRSHAKGHNDKERASVRK